MPPRILSGVPVKELIWLGLPLLAAIASQFYLWNQYDRAVSMRAEWLQTDEPRDYPTAVSVVCFQNRVCILSDKSEGPVDPGVSYFWNSEHAECVKNAAEVGGECRQIPDRPTPAKAVPDSIFCAEGTISVGHYCAGVLEPAPVFKTINGRI